MRMGRVRGGGCVPGGMACSLASAMTLTSAMEKLRPTKVSQLGMPLLFPCDMAWQDGRW